MGQFLSRVGKFLGETLRSILNFPKNYHLWSADGLTGQSHSEKPHLGSGNIAFTLCMEIAVAS